MARSIDRLLERPHLGAEPEPVPHPVAVQQPSGRPRSGDRRSRSLALVGWAVLTTFVLAASAMVHLTMPVGREAAGDTFVALLSSRIRGTASVGEVTRLDFDGLDLTDFRIEAPNGDTVITTERVGGRFELGELFRNGVVQLAPSYFERAEIWITARAPEGQVSLVHAMEVPDGTWTIPVQLKDIRMTDSVMHIQLPGAPPMTMRDVSGIVDLHVGHEFTCRMDQTRGYADLQPIHAGFRHMSGRLTSDNAHPLVVTMMLDAEAAEPSARLDYHVPALEGRQGAPGIGVRLGVDLGVSDERDDCAEGDRDACAEARRDERELAHERAARSDEREQEAAERADRERELN